MGKEFYFVYILFDVLTFLFLTDQDVQKMMK